MGNGNSSESGGVGLGTPNLLSKVDVKGDASDIDAFLAEGRVHKVKIRYITKKQHERFHPRTVNRHVELTNETLKCVKANWAAISEVPDGQSPVTGRVTPLVVFYDTFFSELFEREPSMRAMFEDNMIRQSKFLVGFVNLMTGMEVMLKQALAPVYSFADRSVAMGIRPEHYEVIAAVMPIALETCADTDAWTREVANSWRDVTSFTILVVVEGTVESWSSSYGQSLSEMWNTLSEWRSQRGRLLVGGYGRRLSDRRGSTGSDDPGSPPEAPPPLGSDRLGGQVEVYGSNGARSPMSSNTRKVTSQDGNKQVVGVAANQGLAGDGTVSNSGGGGSAASPAPVLSKQATAPQDSASPEQAWTDGDVRSQRPFRNKENNRDLVNSSVPTADASSVNLGASGTACYLSDADAEVADSSSSPASLHLGQRHEGSGSLYAGGSADERSTRSSPRDAIPRHRAEAFRLGMASSAYDRAGSILGHSSDGIQRMRRPTSTDTGSGNSGALYAKMLGPMSKSRGPFNMRRKKITRSASLEEDEQTQRRRASALQDGRRVAAIAEECVGHDAGETIMRGRGRDAGLALIPGYGRSQSVTTDGQGNHERARSSHLDASTEFDMTAEFGDARGARRKGIVSRMRRMGSNAFRFRSGSRPSSSSGVTSFHLSNVTHGLSRPSSNGDAIPAARLRVSAGSPLSTAVPTPSSATPATAIISPSSSLVSRRSVTSGVVGGAGRKRAGRANSTGGMEGSRETWAAYTGSSVAVNDEDPNAQKVRSTSQTAEPKETKARNAGKGSAGGNMSGTVDNGLRQGVKKDTMNNVGDGGKREGGRGEEDEKGSPAVTGDDNNPWKKMKLAKLKVILEGSTSEEAEKNFSHIEEAIRFHLGPSQPPLTRKQALDVVQTFVQRVVSSRSKDRRSSKIRRRAFRDLLNNFTPLMLDCLESSCGNNRPPGDNSDNLGSLSRGTGGGSAVDGVSREGGKADDGGDGGDVGDSAGRSKGSGEVVVLHFYHQHHQYQLKVAVLETMNTFLMVLRALFRKPQFTRVQKAVAPLLDAEEPVLRDNAAAVLGKLSLCGKDALKWANYAIKVSLEIHSMLQDAWPDEGVMQIPSSQVVSIMDEHPLLPPLQDCFRQGDTEAHVHAIGRRFPALCKLLTTLITTPPPKSHDNDASTDREQPGSSTDGTGVPGPVSLTISLVISLVQRVLRMGQQAWAMAKDSKEGTDVTSSPVEARRGSLPPQAAITTTHLLLPPSVTLLEALVASDKLQGAMADQQELVCQCMGQALAQVPVHGNVRCVAYRSMPYIIRYLRPKHAANGLGVPVLPLLFNEALLALGKHEELHPLNRDASSGNLSNSKRSRLARPPPPLKFNMRTFANNGHGNAIHLDTVWTGLECLATLILDCGIYLPPSQIEEIERIVRMGVTLLASGPLEVSPFDEDEPQVLRHEATREAFFRLSHYYLLLAERKGLLSLDSKLYADSTLAFQYHLQDPDAEVARECRGALTALKAAFAKETLSNRRQDVESSEGLFFGDMEVDADNELHLSSAGENGCTVTLEEGEVGEYRFVRSTNKAHKKGHLVQR